MTALKWKVLDCSVRRDSVQVTEKSMLDNRVAQGCVDKASYTRFRLGNVHTRVYKVARGRERCIFLSEDTSSPIELKSSRYSGSSRQRERNNTRTNLMQANQEDKGRGACS